MSENRLTQGFSTGERRTFKPDAGNVWRLIGHDKAGFDYPDLIGTRIEEMPVPLGVSNA